jgi:hypothetical protein
MKLSSALIILLTAAAALMVILSVSEIREAFHEKSLCSYMMKTGDENALGGPAIAHVAGAKSHGLIVALEGDVSCLLLGVIAGIEVDRRARHKSPKDV